MGERRKGQKEEVGKMATFEKELRLISNPKVASKAWIAEIDLENGSISFLPRIEGDRVLGTYEFEEGKLYIVASDDSSWKNSRQYYTLYLAKDGDLQEIASISFINRRREFDALDDELKSVLKKAYMNAEKNKTTTALIAVAKAYAEREGLYRRPLEEVIREEVEAIAKKHELTLEELIKLLGVSRDG